MKKLYKYYSEGFDIVNHLENPSIKLATTKSLNDPFEQQLTKKLAIDLAQKLINATNQEQNNSTVKENYIELYEKISERYGIVSLTETHRNILMWAHYASSHKGVCVGYKSDFFDKQEKLQSNNKSPQIIYSPQRVKYDSKRFDQELCSETESPYELIMQAMKTKSDEWIYEKEHRCIIPFAWADKFIARKNEHEEIDTKLATQIMALKSTGRITLTTDSKFISEYEFNGMKTTKNIIPDDFLKSQMATYDGVSMLKNIDVASIDAIYLGCQFKRENIIKLTNLISSNKERYGHISVYKYRINQNHFSLDLLPVLNSKIAFDLKDVLLNTVLSGFNLESSVKSD